MTLAAMNATHIRRFRVGDEKALHAVFFSAVHQLASADYSTEQINAWAPAHMDLEMWVQRMRGIQPFVAELDGQIVGYADVQPDGYIDHFFVSGTYPRRGVGTQLMTSIHDEAQAMGITVLTSNVSRTAQPFYARFGFSVVEHRHSVIRGVIVPNALMRKELAASSIDGSASGQAG